MRSILLLISLIVLIAWAVAVVGFAASGTIHLLIIVPIVGLIYLKVDKKTNKKINK